MRVRATLETTTRKMAYTGLATLISGVGVGIYGLVYGWATLTSGKAVLTLQPSTSTQPPAAFWTAAPGASLTWPYHVTMPVSEIPSTAGWLIQFGDALTPLLWGATLAALGLVLVRVGSAPSVFEPQVARALNILSVCLLTLALAPTGLVLWGTSWALESLGWAADPAIDQASLLTPMFGFYLCLAFTTTSQHGARLASELDQVI